jgi:Tetracyclin repressor-like, C-terminal domain
MTGPHMMALDRALAEVEVPPPDPARWCDQLASVARQMRVIIGRHRDIVPAAIGFLPGAGHALHCHERVLAILRASGMPDSQSVAGLYLLWVIVNGFSLEEAQASHADPLRELSSPAASRYLTALLNDGFPNLATLAGEFWETTSDDRFELLIGIFIKGLAASA